MTIPPILFEGDGAPEPPASGVGQKYALGTTVQRGMVQGEDGELPEAYGTQKLLLMARDPHWIYSHWDFTREQQRRYNALSAHHHLVLRLHMDTPTDQPVTEIHVHPESRCWFLHADRAAAKYVGELGYYRADHKWVTIVTSSPVVTPPNGTSEDKTVEFASVPAEPAAKAEPPRPAERLFAPRYAWIQGELFAEAAQPLQPARQDWLTLASAPVTAEWTPARDRAIAEEISRHGRARAQTGSIEISELVRRQGGMAMPEGVVLEAVSSPLGEAQRAKEFGLKVNTDLVVYGETKPDASVTFDGRPITIREDGTFSCRLALPDGEYEVVVEAISAENEVRQARLKVRRCTEYRERNPNGE